MDLEVFTMGGGRERTAAEFRDLFKAAGFTLARIFPTTESISIIETVRTT
jgi:hypothetical protein